MSMEQFKESNSKLTSFNNLSNGFNKTIVEKLHKNKLKLTNQLAILDNEDLEKQFAFTKDEIKDINSKIKNLNVFNKKFITGIELDKNVEYIKSGSDCFDFALGKGLPTGRLTQIYGEASVGKSQICFQMCFKVQLNKFNGGLNAKALYFDTENSFRSERIYQIAKNYYQQKLPNIEDNLLDLKLKQIFNGIYVRSIKTDADDLYKIIVNGQLESFLETHPDIRLIILDSIAYHFRYDYQYDNRTRTRQLISISNKLKQIAYEKNLAILITNQVKLLNEPALGNLWNSIFSNSFCLSKSTVLDNSFDNLSIRQCSVIKSSNCLPGFNFNFIINEFGIVDRQC